MDRRAMNGHELTNGHVASEPAVARSSDNDFDSEPRRIDSRDELEWHRAETERLRVLVEFLARPIHAPGGCDPDPDVLTAYNLAVEAALHGVRRAAATADYRRTTTA
jgi:hypothetical protein